MIGHLDELTLAASALATVSVVAALVPLLQRWRQRSWRAALQDSQPSASAITDPSDAVLQELTETEEHRTEAKQPSVLIMASQQTLAIARHLDESVEAWASVVTLGGGIFRDLGPSLQSLRKFMETFDYVVVTLSADDLVSRRVGKVPAPRDTMLFQLGFCVGIWGSQKVFLVHGQGDSIDLPEYLGSLVNLTYKMQEHDNPQAMLSPVAEALRQAIERR